MSAAGLMYAFRKRRVTTSSRNVYIQELVGRLLAVKQSSGDQVAIESILDQFRRVLDVKMLHHRVLVKSHCTR